MNRGQRWRRGDTHEWRRRPEESRADDDPIKMTGNKAESHYILVHRSWWIEKSQIKDPVSKGNLTSMSIAVLVDVLQKRNSGTAGWTYLY